VAGLDRDDPGHRRQAGRRQVGRLAVVRADDDVLELRRRAGEALWVAQQRVDVRPRTRGRRDVAPQRLGQDREVLALLGRDRGRDPPELAGQRPQLRGPGVEPGLDPLDGKEEGEHAPVLTARRR
jgi:hypothetical protein